jgi:polar amino acid transport system substrate-binding protein
MRGRGKITIILTAIVLLTAIALTTSASAATSPPAGNKAIAKLLPNSIRTLGVITYADEPYFPPFILTHNAKNPSGVDVDLATAIGKLFGVRMALKVVPFSSELAGIQARRFDMTFDDVADNAARRKVVNFVDYIKSAVGFFVLAHNPSHITTPMQLCGKNVGVTSGTLEGPNLALMSKTCGSKGLGAIGIHSYPDESSMILALVSGRTQAFASDESLGNYAAKADGGKFELGGNMPGRIFHSGMIFNKSDAGLTRAVQAALNALILNGTYTRILRKWGEEAVGLSKATINDGFGLKK